MSPITLRFIALVMVPCLLTPPNAAAFEVGGTRGGLGNRSFTQFQRQALTLALVEACRPFARAGWCVRQWTNTRLPQSERLILGTRAAQPDKASSASMDVAISLLFVPPHQFPGTRIVGDTAAGKSLMQSYKVVARTPEQEKMLTAFIDERIRRLSMDQGFGKAFGESEKGLTPLSFLTVVMALLISAASAGKVFIHPHHLGYSLIAGGASLPHLAGVAAFALTAVWPLAMAVLPSAGEPSSDLEAYSITDDAAILAFLKEPGRTEADLLQWGFTREESRCILATAQRLQALEGYDTAYKIFSSGTISPRDAHLARLRSFFRNPRVTATDLQAWRLLLKEAKSLYGLSKESVSTLLLEGEEDAQAINKLSLANPTTQAVFRRLLARWTAYKKDHPSLAPRASPRVASEVSPLRVPFEIPQPIWQAFLIKSHFDRFDTCRILFEHLHLFLAPTLGKKAFGEYSKALSALRSAVFSTRGVFKAQTFRFLVDGKPYLPKDRIPFLTPTSVIRFEPIVRPDQSSAVLQRAA